MDRKEHVHIISAGEKIHIAYPTAFRELPAISRTIVFADSTIHDGSPDPVTEKHRLAVRNAVSAVQEISASLSIPFTREVIFPPAYDSVRSALAKCRALSAGSLGLMVWMSSLCPLCGDVQSGERLGGA